LSGATPGSPASPVSSLSATASPKHDGGEQSVSRSLLSSSEGTGAQRVLSAPAPSTS
jgi:hypothetical protein